MGKPVREILGNVWKAVDATSRVTLNLVFLGLVVAVVVLAAQSGGPKVPKGGALVLRPEGAIVEQLGGDPLERAVDALTGQAEPQTLLVDLLDAVEAARDDDRVKVLVLDLDEMGGAGLTKLEDLGRALDDFKASGKTVVAVADNYDQGRYFLAAHANEIWMHEMGMVLIEGFGRYRTYYKDAIDRLEVDWNVFRVGEFKSAVEPYLRNGPSDEARLADAEWLGDLWQAWLADVAAARGLRPEEIGAYVEGFPERVQAAAGDTAKVAVEARLVDHAAGRDAVRARLVELAGEDEDTHSYRQIAHPDYLERLGDDRPSARGTGDAVGVIVASGTILDGHQPPGKIGGDSTAALVRQARDDEEVKAVVLRVDSGGGSGFASEVIRRELELTRAAGKPVVASMGSVAASGGYWVTMAADEVWAAPTTITGSIGIFGMFPTFQKPLAKYLGVHVDGVGTTRLAGALRPDRALDPVLAQTIQSIVEHGYQDFITKVAEARETTPEAVDAIARGRVWSGADAHQLGLVDHLGTLDDAVAAAARLAKLEDGYRVRTIEKEMELKDRVMAELLSGAAAFAGEHRLTVSPGPLESSLRRWLRREAELLADLNDPHGLYALCLCEVE